MSADRYPVISGRVVVLTGAGISAESGIRTFRDTGGLWEEYAIEDVATPEGFERDPLLVWRFYNQRRLDLATAQPNAGHRALVDLERRLGDDFLLVTQNVDDLHEKAGSSRLLHMHGELLVVRCLSCGTVTRDATELPDEPRCPSCNGRLRPHIVWFGEIPLHMDEIMDALRDCDWFLSVGTSGLVYPAAQFIEIARRAGARTLTVNPDPDARGPHSDLFIQENAGTALPKLVERLGNPGT